MSTDPSARIPWLRARIARLVESHQTVKAKIRRERKRPMPCSFALQTLKRQRLRLKDEISRCSGLLAERVGPAPSHQSV